MYDECKFKKCWTSDYNFYNHCCYYFVLFVVVIGGWIFWKHKLKTHYEIAQIQQSKRKIWIWFMQDHHWNYAFHYCFIICVLEHGECLPIIVLNTSLCTQISSKYMLVYSQSNSWIVYHAIVFPNTLGTKGGEKGV